VNAETEPRRVVLVTGASRNIGRAIAVAFARAAYSVACFGRDRARLDETAALVRAAGSAASVHVGNVASDDDLESFVKASIAAHAGIDVVVNNAGMMSEVRAVDMPPAEFRKVLDVNLVAYYALARAAYSELRRRSGVVVNIGSFFGSLGVASAAAYCASKAGIEGLTRALAAEWARDGIRTFCVAPGYVESDISRAALADPETYQRIVRRIPLGRIAKPDEIAEFVTFLASPRASYFNGETIIVDGGQRMKL
jgi:NAD(P)-dependent dehydrogenase (short-subunit alcohol dehydrogenase family)